MNGSNSSAELCLIYYLLYLSLSDMKAEQRSLACNNFKIMTYSNPPFCSLWCQCHVKKWIQCINSAGPGQTHKHTCPDVLQFQSQPVIGHNQCVICWCSVCVVALWCRHTSEFIWSTSECVWGHCHELTFLQTVIGARCFGVIKNLPSSDKTLVEYHKGR